MTKIDLTNQTKGILPQANNFMTDLNSAATMLGYPDYITMIGILTSQIEANREASGAAPVIGYIIPTP